MQVIAETLGTYIGIVGGCSFYHELGRLVVGLLQGARCKKFVINLPTFSTHCSLVRSRKLSHMEKLTFELVGSLCGMTYLLTRLRVIRENTQACIIGALMMIANCYCILPYEKFSNSVTLSKYFNYYFGSGEWKKIEWKITLTTVYTMGSIWISLAYILSRPSLT